MTNKETIKKETQVSIARIRENLVKIDNVVEDFDTTFPEMNTDKLARLKDLHNAKWRLLVILDMLDNIETEILS